MKYTGILLGVGSSYLAIKYNSPLFAIFNIPSFLLYTGGEITQIPTGLTWQAPSERDKKL
jgi:hypothetical protein